MKTKADPRHQKRVVMMKYLFSLSFHRNDKFSPPSPYQAFPPQQSQIDQLIQTCAPEWPLDQINKVDLAILRLAIFELTQTDIPHKVIIDEAVELAKEYGSENSSKFVNGVLGTALTNLKSLSADRPATPDS